MMATVMKRRSPLLVLPASSPISSSSLFLFLFFFVTSGGSVPILDEAAGSLGPLSTISFDEGYIPLFADFNIRRSNDSMTASLVLNRYAGSGFISAKYYDYGFFSAKIKLPRSYTAGVVVAFYTSNGDVFEKSHDELDIEFLGNIQGKPWRFQTNVYGNGSTKRGREERYKMWFDPTADYHRYSILWNSQRIHFFVDDVPIREVIRNEAMGGDYPSKPMSVYATIWDASSWATSGGRYAVRYEYEPFVAEFTDFVLEGCGVDPIEQVSDGDTPAECSEKKSVIEQARYAEITPEGRAAMRWVRERYMYYSYCYDNKRYPVALPECESVVVPTERARFKESGRLKFEAIPRKQQRRPRRVRGSGKGRGGRGRKQPVMTAGPMVVAGRTVDQEDGQADM